MSLFLVIDCTDTDNQTNTNQTIPYNKQSNLVKLKKTLKKQPKSTDLN